MTAKSRYRKRRASGREWDEGFIPDGPREVGADEDARLTAADWGLTTDQARGKLRARICPVCGEGPWDSPLNHASRKHGIDKFTMRDACGLTTTESITAPEASAKWSNNGKRQAEAGKDFRAMGELRSGKRRFTRAGSEHVTANVANAVAAMTDDERAAFIERRAAASRAAQPKRLATLAAKRRREVTP
jgi:hypothetical protein